MWFLFLWQSFFVEDANKRGVTVRREILEEPDVGDYYYQHDGITHQPID